jgi:glycosyltransferase involved in cell wall biosynthesis
MRIAYFTNTYPRATDTFIQREVAGLRARGFDVHTFSVRRSGSDHDVSAVLAEKKTTDYLLPVNPARLLLENLRWLFSAPMRYGAALGLAWQTAQPGLRGFCFQFFYFQEAVLLASRLRRCNITHLHNHLGDASGTVTLLAGRLSGIPYSITTHGPHIFFDPLHWALREKTRDSRFIACISHYCRSQMMLFTDQADWPRLRIVHCGVDPELFRFTPVRPRARRLLYTGRLAAEKGLPVLFESLALLRDKDIDYELTLVGDGPDRAALEMLANRLGIADRLRFAGFADQNGVRDLLMASDIFILPSFAEGVPVSLMEAMACGVPVIATNVGGVTELVEPEKTGLVVPPASVDALAEAIARYLSDPDLRRLVAENGRRKVEADFNLDTEVDRLASLFRGNDMETRR